MTGGNWVHVDCEAEGPCPALGRLTEFGAVHHTSGASFHGVIWPSVPDPANPAKPVVTGPMVRHPEVVFAEFAAWLVQVCDGRPAFISDNVAYDWQWINHGFWTTLDSNPFGHSGRRISDFYAGLTGDFRATQRWKRLRVTAHDHNPVHDARGNAEALRRLLAGERPS